MPCWEVATLTVNFTVDEDLLTKTLEKMNLPVYRREGSSVIATARGIKFDVKGKKIVFDDSRQVIKKVNEIKRAYSETVIESVAKKKKWVMKKTGNKIVCKKY